LHFAIFKRFKEEKLLETPLPDATKIEIAGFKEFGRILAPADGQPQPWQREAWRAFGIRS
jgi:hypothetical protein